MNLKNLFFFFMLFSTAALFSFSEPPTAPEKSEKVEVPVLSEEEQKIFNSYQEGNPDLRLAYIFRDIGATDRSNDLNDVQKHNKIAQLEKVAWYMLAKKPGLAGIKVQNHMLPIQKAIGKFKQTDSLLRLLKLTPRELLTLNKLQSILLYYAETKSADAVFAAELIKRGAVPDEQLLAEATKNDNIDMMKLLLAQKVPVDAPGAEGNRPIEEVTSKEAFSLLVNANAKLSYMVDNPNKNYNYPWLKKQTWRFDDDIYDQDLVTTVLRKLKETENLRNMSNDTTLCAVAEIIARPQESDAYIYSITNITDDKNKNDALKRLDANARQFAHLLMDYGAQCHERKLQETLNFLKGERAVFPQSLVPTSLMDEIHEFTGAKLPTVQKEQQKFGEPTETKEQLNPPTASVSVLAEQNTSSAPAQRPRIIGGVPIMSSTITPTGRFSARSSSSTSAASKDKSIKSLDEED